MEGTRDEPGGDNVLVVVMVLTGMVSLVVLVVVDGDGADCNVSLAGCSWWSG